MDTDFEGLIQTSDYRGYLIDSILLDVHVKNQRITGGVIVKDEEGAADVNIELNMSEKPAQYNIQGLLSDIDLKHYQFTDQEIELGSQVYINVFGDSLELLNGEVQLFNTQLHRPDTNTSLLLPDVYLRSDQNKTTYKNLQLRSDLGDMDLVGTFTFQKASQLFQRLLYEGQLYFGNNDSLIQAYYASKPLDTTDVQVNMKFTPRDSINRLLDFLFVPLHVTPHDSILGNMYFSRTEYAEVSGEMDSVVYQGQTFKQTNVSISVAKFADQPELNIASGIEIDTFLAGNVLMLEDVSIDLDGSESQIETDLFFQQREAGNRFQLKVQSVFFPDKIVSTIDSVPSMFILQEDTLRVSEWNVGTYQNQGFLIENLKVSGIDRSVTLAGEISRAEESEFFIDVNEWNIGVISDVLDLSYEPGGVLVGKATIKQPLNNSYVDWKGKITDFSIGDFIYGNINSEISWDRSLEVLRPDIRLIDENLEKLRLVGNYYTDTTTSPLEINLITQHPFPLNYISPFTKDQLYGIEGNVALESFQILGNWDDLQVTGTGHFENAVVGIDFFQSIYKFNGNIQFDENRINFPRITLYDPGNHTAEFYGDIYHQGLKDFSFDLQLEEMNNFQLMNTGPEDQEAFYGKIILANGVAAITGDLSQLDIEAYVMTGPQSTLKIPVSDYEKIEKPDYIQFLSEDELDNTETSTTLEGFDLNLTVSATEAAEIELIFDERAGDIIKGRGNGNLNMLINEEGQISLSGSYEITAGEYLFTSQNVINKKFTVKPGGTINWSGDPYDAQLNLEAIYTLSATLPITEAGASTQDNGFSPRVPVNVLMAMKGSLGQPEISLSIELPSVTEQEIGAIASYFRAVKYDEQELNKQVFSLLVFNKFAPAGGLLDNQAGGSGVTTSISELISNQINYWLSQAINENLNVNVSTQNFQDVNLLISAKLFNERVIVERNGLIIGSQNDGSNFPIGDLSLIIKLLPSSRQSTAFRRSGELVLEVFNRANFAEIQRQITSANQTGLGIFFKKDFDNLPDLLKQRKKD